MTAPEALAKAAIGNPPTRDQHDEAAQLVKLFQQAAFEQGPPACMLSDDGKLLYENAAFQRIKPALELAGLLPEGGSAAGSDVEEKQRITIEIGHRHKHYNCRKVDLATGSTSVRGFIYDPLVQDGCALAEVSRLKSKLDDLTRLASDWVWETDRDLKFTALSARSLDILGRHPQELLGTSLLALPSTAKQDALDGLVNNTRAPFRDLDIDVRHADGNLRHLRLSGLPVYDQCTGDFLGLRGTAADITIICQREQDLIESKESAELANRTKTEFLANMSHELRTPLNAVIGFAEIMESELLGPLGNAQYKSYAEDIRNSAEHLLTLINDILDISKIEAGSHQLYYEEVCPKEVLDRVCRLIGDRCLRAGVTLLRNFDVALPPLFVDERKIKQVLLNLLANAAKYTPEGGRIDVRASYIEGTGFEFIIEDTGVGIADSDMQAAFTPFDQIKNEQNQQHQGTGLGLPLSRGFMKLHGGELTLESIVGEGTKAVARLPENCVLPKKGPCRQSA